MYPPQFGSGLTMNAPPLANVAAMSGGYMMNSGSRHSINMNSDFSSLPPVVNMLNVGKDMRMDGGIGGTGNGDGVDAPDHNLNHLHQLDGLLEHRQ